MSSNEKYEKEFNQLREFMDVYVRFIGVLFEMIRCYTEFDILKDEKNMEKLLDEMERRAKIQQGESGVKHVNTIRSFLLDKSEFQEALEDSVRVGAMTEEQKQSLMEFTKFIN